jgi:hypothetical protein
MPLSTWYTQKVEGRQLICQARMSLIMKVDIMSLSFIMSMASLSYNDTIQLSLSGSPPQMLPATGRAI